MQPSAVRYFHIGSSSPAVGLGSLKTNPPKGVSVIRGEIKPYAVQCCDVGPAPQAVRFVAPRTMRQGTIVKKADDYF
ncbi:hypothetical protein O6C87_12615, partial [Legionella pneumophila]|uniref:hypothetical protein n=1 Tax=Legionella pneumophila TaxID=446 RepID=UPI0022B4ABA1